MERMRIKKPLIRMLEPSPCQSKLNAVPSIITLHTSKTNHWKAPTWVDCAVTEDGSRPPPKRLESGRARVKETNDWHANMRSSECTLDEGMSIDLVRDFKDEEVAFSKGLEVEAPTRMGGEGRSAFESK